MEAPGTMSRARLPWAPILATLFAVAAWARPSGVASPAGPPRLRVSSLELVNSRGQVLR